MSEAVRQAVVKPSKSAPVAEPKNPDRPVSGVSVNVPVSLHEEINGTPYSAVFFGVTDLSADSDLSFGENAKKIDSAYRDMVEKGELEDGEASFKAFIKDAIKATDSEHAPVRIKMAKVAEFVRFMSRLERIGKDEYGR